MRLRLKNLLVSFFLATGLVSATASFVAAQDNYVIRPGDTLQIEVLEDSGLNRSTLVLPDGSISFPMVGTLSVKGRTVEQLGQSLGAALAPNFASPPNVYVSVASLTKTAPRGTGTGSRKVEVYAIGEVTIPGMIEVKQGTTILQFLAESGGLTKFAAEKRIELHRTDSKTGAITTYRFNYLTPAGGDSGISGGTKLAAGDVIKVPRRRLFE